MRSELPSGLKVRDMTQMSLRHLASNCDSVNESRLAAEQPPLDSNLLPTAEQAATAAMRPADGATVASQSTPTPARKAQAECVPPVQQRGFDLADEADAIEVLEPPTDAPPQSVGSDQLFLASPLPRQEPAVFCLNATLRDEFDAALTGLQPEPAAKPAASEQYSPSQRLQRGIVSQGESIGAAPVTFDSVLSAGPTRYPGNNHLPRPFETDVPLSARSDSAPARCAGTPRALTSDGLGAARLQTTLLPASGDTSTRNHAAASARLVPVDGSFATFPSNAPREITVGTKFCGASGCHGLHGLVGPPDFLGDARARAVDVARWIENQGKTDVPFDELVLQLEAIGVQLSVAEQDAVRRLLSG